MAERRPWALVVGGAGYVAGPVVRALIGRGVAVTVLDDLSAGHEAFLPLGTRLVRGRMGDDRALAEALSGDAPHAVFHFAGRTEVGLSMEDPAEFYRVNVGEGTALLHRIARLGRPVVFSSSAGVYGTPDLVPIPERQPLRPVHPYGETKRVMETALEWAGRAYGLPWIALRYFNAAGSVAGVPERHTPETHLIPNLLTAAATGVPVTLFGTDYPTPDGTAVRDYVHVKDLADGHLAAMDHLCAGGASGAVNLGSGRGTSVAEVLATAERAVGRPIPHRYGDRRAGDPPTLVADIARARQMLHFSPARSDIDGMVSDAWAAFAGTAVTRG